MSALVEGAAMIAPFLITLIFNGVVAGICFYAFNQTRMRGWRLMAIASIIRLAATLPRIYATGALRREGVAVYGQWMRWLGVAEFAITPVTAVLTILGLLALLEDVRRLRR